MFILPREEIILCVTDGNRIFNVFRKDICNTVLSLGKNELAKILIGTSSRTIDTIWAKIGSEVYSCKTNNTRIENQLVVSGSFNVAGVYSDFYSGSSITGYYNSISYPTTLIPDQSLLVSIIWTFEGDQSNIYGSRICASRLGGIRDQFDYSLSKVALPNSILFDAYYVANNNQISFESSITTTDLTMIDHFYASTSGMLPFSFFNKFNQFTISSSNTVIIGVRGEITIV